MMTPSVIEIDLRQSAGGFLREDSRIRSAIAAAIADAPEGRHIRLRVGTCTPPLWVLEFMRPDLFWQVVAADERTLTRWERAIEGTVLA